jgi:hypothetical protein
LRRSKIFDRELEKPSGFEVLRKRKRTALNIRVKSAGAGERSPAPFFLIPDYFSKLILKKNEEYQNYCTATNAAEAWDGGTERPSSSNPFTWSSMASCIRCSVSSRVFPVATQPGRSGEYAE